MNQGQRPWLVYPALAAALVVSGVPAGTAVQHARVSGHVEATEVQVAPEVAGRILEMRVAEGDRVAAKDVVARLDTRDTELQIQRARADRAAADAQLRLLRAGSREEDIRQAEAQVASRRGRGRSD